MKSTSGTCVKLYDDNKSWEDARATCKEDGADLVTILDESMNNFIWGKDDFRYLPEYSGLLIS